MRRRPVADARVGQRQCRPVATGPASQVWIRFRYWTDGATVGDGISIDNIAITGLPTDGAETDPGWDLRRLLPDQRHDHHRSTPATTSPSTARTSATTGRSARARTTSPIPRSGRPKWVQHFPYQDGLLIWYWDTAQDDNNVGDHPGQRPDPADRRPLQDLQLEQRRRRSTAAPVVRRNVHARRRRRSCRSSTCDGTKLRVPSHAARPVFDDEIRYWQKTDSGDAPGDGRYQAAWNSVKNPHTGTKIRILDIYHRACSWTSGSTDPTGGRTASATLIETRPAGLARRASS